MPIIFREVGSGRGRDVNTGWERTWVARSARVGLRRGPAPPACIPAAAHGAAGSAGARGWDSSALRSCAWGAGLETCSLRVRCGAGGRGDSITGFSRDSSLFLTSLRIAYRENCLVRTSGSSLLERECIPWHFPHLLEAAGKEARPLHILYVWFVVLILRGTEVSIADILLGLGVKTCREQLAFGKKRTPVWWWGWFFFYERFCHRRGAACGCDTYHNPGVSARCADCQEKCPPWRCVCRLRSPCLTAGTAPCLASLPLGIRALNKGVKARKGTKLPKQLREALKIL